MATPTPTWIRTVSDSNHRRKNLRGSGVVKSDRRSFAVVALSACIVGLVVSPFPFVIIGASDFRPVFYVVEVLPFVLCSLFLFWRYLSKPADVAIWRIPGFVVESAAWIVIAQFLFLVSRINLLVGAERWGAVAESFLAASAISLPIILKRRTALERRLVAQRKGVVIAALLSILVAAAVAVIVDLVTPTRFILGTKRLHSRRSVTPAMLKLSASPVVPSGPIVVTLEPSLRN